MESLLFVLNAVALVAMLILGMFDEKRGAKEGLRSIFRYKVTAAADAAKPHVGFRPGPERR